MAEPQNPEPAKLFAGIITGSADLLPEVKTALEKQLGPVDCESETMPFDKTFYYEPQMGKDLLRKFYGFEKLVEQDALAGIKLAANALEKEFIGRLPVERPVNLDPGILLASKMILASCKDFSHRIYLGSGVYAEVTLQYVHGAFRALPWTFPDFRQESYHAFFLKLREIYMTQLHFLGRQEG